MLRWDLRTLLHAYLPLARQDALAQYNWDSLIYWEMVQKVKDPGKAPEIPALLRTR